MSFHKNEGLHQSRIISKPLSSRAQRRTAGINQQSKKMKRAALYNCLFNDIFDTKRYLKSAGPSLRSGRRRIVGI
jgi:hypothetical protein